MRFKNSNQFNELLDIIRSTKEETEDRVYFQDIGKAVFCIDKETGEIRKKLFKDGKYSKVRVASIETSKHVSGYLVCRVQGKSNFYAAYQHRLICLATHTDELLELLKKEEPSNICVCHIDGRRWNNRPDNLEWGTSKDNARQARYVSALYYYYGEEFTEFNSLSWNSDGVIVLKQGIKNRAIKEFEEWMKIDQQIEVEKIGLTGQVMEEFVKFMFSHSYWR